MDELFFYLVGWMRMIRLIMTYMGVWDPRVIYSFSIEKVRSCFADSISINTKIQLMYHKIDKQFARLIWKFASKHGLAHRPVFGRTSSANIFFWGGFSKYIRDYSFNLDIPSKSTLNQTHEPPSHIQLHPTNQTHPSYWWQFSPLIFILSKGIQLS